MHPSAVLSHLWARFSYNLDHYGRARSRRRASAHRGEVPLYLVYIWYIIRNDATADNTLLLNAECQLRYQGTFDNIPQGYQGTLVSP